MSFRRELLRGEVLYFSPSCVHPRKLGLQHGSVYDRQFRKSSQQRVSLLKKYLSNS